MSLGVGVPTAYLASTRSFEGFNPIILALMFGSLVFAAVLNVFIYRGRNWARIITLLLVLVSAFFLLFPSDEETPPDLLEDMLNVLSLALDLSATYLLFFQPGALWFRRSTE